MTDDASTTSRSEFTQRAVEAVVRIALIVVLVAWCFEIAQPFVVPVIWGIILAVASYSGFDGLRARLGGRAVPAAALVTLIGLLLLCGPVAYLGIVLLENLRDLAAELRAGSLNVPPPPEAVATWPLVGESIYEFWDLASDNLEVALRKIEPQLKSFGGWLVLAVAKAGFSFLAFVLAIVIGGILLVHAATGEQAALTVVRRLAGERGPNLVELAQSTIRNVVQGILGIALVQAVLAGIGLVVVEIPGAGLLTFLVIILSALQIGPGLILIPAMIYVIATAEVATWLPFVIWTVPVMLLDNVLKPILLARGLGVPKLVIFIGVIGGTLAHGLIGLFVGPVVLALGYVLFSAWLHQQPPGAETADSKA